MKQWLQQSVSSAYFFFFLPLHIDSISCLFLSSSSYFCYFLFVSIPSICLFLPPCPFLCFPSLSLCSLSPFCLFPHLFILSPSLSCHLFASSLTCLSPCHFIFTAYSFLPFLLIPIFHTLAPFHRLFIYPFLLSLHVPCLSLVYSISSFYCLVCSCPYCFPCFIFSLFHLCTVSSFHPLLSLHHLLTKVSTHFGRSMFKRYTNTFWNCCFKLNEHRPRSLVNYPRTVYLASLSCKRP